MHSASPPSGSGAQRKRRRVGGSTARRAQYSVGPPSRAVTPGMIGGRYQPLTAREIQLIHGTALDILETIGVGDPTAEVLYYARPGGCILGEDNRLRFPRALVEDLIDTAAKSYVMHAPDARFDREVSGQRVYFSSAGEAVRILDFDRQCFRPTKLVDLYDAARLADQLEHIHAFGQPFIAAEYSDDLYVHDLNIAYAALAGTRKSFALGIAEVAHIEPIIALFDTCLGRVGAFLQRPFCTFGGCPIVSPLRFAKENTQVLIRIAELGLVGDIAIAPLAGATAPAALAGTLAQAFAETLACLALTNLVRPGSAINFGMWPFVADLRTGAFTGGSGEQSLIMAATAQLCNYYGLITSVSTGMTDAKTMDAQAGFEKGISTTAAALAGGNLISAYPGIVNGLLAQSFAGMVIDNDMLGCIQRLLRGIDVTDTTLSYDVIAETITGNGHFLAHEQTLELMQHEYLYPDIGNRNTVHDWQENGRRTVYQAAHDKAKTLLAHHYPRYIPAGADAGIRRHFPIRLRSDDMRPGNGRW